jgi:zinc protease
MSKFAAHAQMAHEELRMKRRGTVLLAVLLLAGLGGAVGVARAQTEKPAPEASAPKVKLVPHMPSGAPSKPFQFPKAATKTLPNGLRVFVVSSSEEPAVTVRLVLTAAGTVHDPAGKPGVAAMAANLLAEGTEKRTAQQIAEAIDFVGGSLTAGADSDGTYITATVVKKDFDLAMDLLADVTLHAAFQKEELERRREQALSNLQVSYADPNYLATAIFDRVVYGPHPYGLPQEGTPDSVGQLDRDDLVRFRDAYYVPNQSLIAFAGDISPEAAFAAAEKYLGAWAKKEVPATPIAAPASSRGLRIFLIDKPDAVQTQIRVGCLGIRRNDPDYIPLYVTNRIFGGGFNSRLNTEVRQKKGLTYDASSLFSSRKLAGLFEASTFTRTETTVEAAKLVVDLIRQMATGEVTKAELDFARDYLIGVFPILSETAEQVAGRTLNVAQFDLPADYNDTYQQRVRAVGTGEVKAVAARYFDAENLGLVLVGNARQFREALKKAFPAAAFEEIPFDQVDLLSADLRKHKEAAPAK